MNLITFALAGKEYAVEITQIREVTKMSEVTPVPDAADFVEGVINLRGKVIPLISLRKKLGFKEQELNKSNRIIITQVDSHVLGLVVDGKIDVVAVEPENITPPDDVLKKAKYLAGVGRIGERLILIADVEKFFTDKEKTGIKKVHGKIISGKDR